MDALTDSEYVARILTTQVYDVARVTPVDEAKALSGRLGCRVFLKREDLQCVHSFKLRGAYCKMRSLPREALQRGVLAASAGNHAQGVALSAAKEASRMQRGCDFTLIPPYDDPDVIAGQGTVAKELLEQVPDMDSVYVPVGGGGFAAGVAVYLKSVKPSVRVYGVEPCDSDCMSRSIRAGRRVTLRSPGLFADGVCVKTPGREPFRLCRRLLDGMVRVSTTETCAAIRDVFEATRAVCEPAGALSVAAARKSARRGERAVCIVSGANINFDSIRSVIEHAASERQIKSNGGEKGGQ